MSLIRAAGAAGVFSAQLLGVVLPSTVPWSALPTLHGQRTSTLYTMCSLLFI